MWLKGITAAVNFFRCYFKMLSFLPSIKLANPYFHYTFEVAGVY